MKMKRIRCPKCDESIPFDPSPYAPGRTLVFQCPSCNGQFRIRIPDPAATKAVDDETPEREPIAFLVVLENAFQLRQEIPLYEGDNIVGRYVRGTRAGAAFKTVDPSIDTTHCIITVRRKYLGHPARFQLRDAPSTTGTFLANHLLGRNERALIEDGDIITIGAGTMLLRLP